MAVSGHVSARLTFWAPRRIVWIGRNRRRAESILGTCDPLSGAVFRDERPYANGFRLGYGHDMTWFPSHPGTASPCGAGMGEPLITTSTSSQ
jgi:hypothetical protein